MLKFIITLVLVSYLLMLIWRGLIRILRGGNPQSQQQKTKPSGKKQPKVNYDNVIDADFEVIEENKSKSEKKD